MNVSDRRPLGRSGLEVTVLGFGGVPLGNLYRTCTDEEATATVRAAYDAGIRLFDTAPLYGFGMSEHRIGAAMRELPRDFLDTLDQDRSRAARGQGPGRARRRQLRQGRTVPAALRLHL